jgi:hypothetical protein
VLQQLREREAQGQAHAIAAAGAEHEKAVRARVLEQVAQDRDVAPAVALDLLDAPLAPPAQRLEAVAGLGHAERLFAQVAEREAEAEPGVDRIKQVEGREREAPAGRRIAAMSASSFFFWSCSSARSGNRSSARASGLARQASSAGSA